MSNEVNEIVNSIESLTPKSNNTDSKIYIKLLEDGVCNREDTTNIALSGPYGAGKSTVLYQFKKLNKTQNRFLNISMASFDEYNNITVAKKTTAKKVTGETKAEESLPQKTDVNAIEKSILQQMIYSVGKNELPLSKFHRISSISKNEIENNVFSILTWLMFLILFFSSESIHSVFYRFSFPEYTYYIFFTIISFLTIYLTSKNISNFYYQLKKLKLNKVVFKDTEVVFSESDSSVLNKNIDEILYFFEATKTDVMIVEDLDRFDNPEIFVNLRELNNQINNSHQVPQKVTFIYAVKEDMFKNEDRVKFFDLIIPVIPFINSENSNEMITNKLKNLNLENKISKDFITGISLFISDMRLLTNIVNEFLVYYSKLSNKTHLNEYSQKIESEINLEKLFAIIIYKNFHPDDFTKLHKREGDLFTLIHKSKSQLITSLSKDLQRDILSILENKKTADSIIEGSLSELRKNFMLEFGYKHNIKQLHFNSHVYSLIDIANDIKLFNQLNNLAQIKVMYHNRSNWTDTDISTILKKALIELDYSSKEELLSKKLDNNEKSFDSKIEKLHQEILQFNKMNISELVSLNDDDTLVPKSILDSEILYYLIINTHIDEEYASYISLIHDLSVNEISFLRKVKNNQETDATEKLNNIEAIMTKLSQKDFAKLSVLNIHLVNHLIKNINRYEAEYKAIMELLKKDDDIANDFIYFYIISEYSNNPYFINSLAKNRDDLWNMLSSEFLEKGFHEDDWIKLLFKDVDLEHIFKLNKQTNGIASHIQEMPNFARFVVNNELPMKKIEEFIKTTDVRLESLNRADSDEEKKLFEFICKNNLYIINKDTLKVISSHYSQHDVSYENAVSYEKLSLLKGLDITQYIDENIDMYVSHAYQKIEHKESLESIKSIIDNYQLLDTYRKEIIKDMDNVFNNITFVDELSWHYLLEYQKIKPTWENVLQVYIQNDNSISEELIVYINDKNVAKELHTQSLQLVSGYEEDDDIQFLTDFRFQLYFQSDLSNENLKLYKSTSDRCWKALSLSDFDAQKLEILVVSQYLCVEPDNYHNLKSHESNNKQFHLKLIEQNYTKFEEEQDDYDLSTNDIIYLLNSSKPNNTAKVEIFNSLYVNDINSQIPFEFTKSIILNSQTEQETKIELIINQMEYFTKNEAIELVSKLDEKYQKITKNRQFEVEHNDLNINLTSELKEYGFIKDAIPMGGKSAGRLRIRTIK